MWKKAILGVLLVDFAVLTVWVLAQYDYSLGAALTAAVASPIGVHLLVDLALACFAACVWMVRDARAHGRVAWPWVVATMLLGSPGPVAYLLVRELRSAPVAQPSMREAHA